MFFLFRKSKRERLVVVLLDQRDDVTAHDILQHHKHHAVRPGHSVKTFAHIILYTFTGWSGTCKETRPSSTWSCTAASSARTCSLHCFVPSCSRTEASAPRDAFTGGCSAAFSRCRHVPVHVLYQKAAAILL